MIVAPHSGLARLLVAGTAAGWISSHWVLRGARDPLRFCDGTLVVAEARVPTDRRRIWFATDEPRARLAVNRRARGPVKIFEYCVRHCIPRVRELRA